MTRNDRRLRRKKPLGIGAFFVFLLVLLNIIGLLAAVVVATPLGKLFLFDAETGFFASMNEYVVPRVQTWLLDAFNMSHTVFGMGEVQTAYVYLVALYEAFMLSSLFFFFPFFVMGHNRIVNKKGKTWRMVVQIIDILILLALLTFGLLFLFARHPVRGEAFVDLDKAIYQPFFALFEEGNALHLFGISVRNNLNPELSGAVFIVCCVFLLSFILNIVGLAGKNKYYAVSEESEEKAAPATAMPAARPQVVYGYRVTPIPSAEHFIIQQPPVHPAEGNIPPAVAPNGAPRIEPVVPVPTAERGIPQVQPDLSVPAPVELKTQPEPVAEVTEEVFVLNKDTIDSAPAKTEAVPEPQPEITRPVEKSLDKPVETAPVAAQPTPTEPVAVSSVKEEPRKPERVWIQPTCREVSILNALDPILPSESIALPALRETDVPAILSELEPFKPVPVIDLPEEEKEMEEAAEKATNLQANNVPVDYLPGIDDHILSPWGEKEPAKEDVTEVAKPEEVEEVPVETIQPSAEEVKIAEKTEEVPEEKTEEVQPVEEKVEETPAPMAPIVATILPDVEEVYVEEKAEEAAVEAEAPVTEEKTEAVPEEKAETEPEETVEETKPAIIAINEIESDGKRLQEEDHPDNEIVRGASRYEHRVLINKNELETKESTTLDEGWTIPGFVEIPMEKKPVEEKVVEKVVIVEKKAEETRPAEPIPAPVADEGGTEVEGKRRFTLVDPLQHEKEEEKIVEEKKLEAISGPLHQIRERKRDIQLVEPTKVKFDLKAYQIKTYQGDLTPEEAFLKGVTKVQPKVNPIFANQANDDSWKQKKIDEENRKSGFFNVSQGKIVKPTRPISQKPSNVKITSIRDLAKARKAQNEEGKEDKEEN